MSVHDEFPRMPDDRGSSADGSLEPDAWQDEWEDAEGGSFAARWLKRRRGGSGGDGRKIWILVILFAVIGGGAWWWSQVRPGLEPPVPTPTMAGIAPAEAATPPEVEPLELPPLAESDGIVRSLVSGLSAHPQVAQWAVTDGLVDRFVVSVVNLAAGDTPSTQLPFLVPEGEFRVLEVEEEGETHLVIDPATYRRYDLLTETLVSLDTPGAVTLYHQLRPLIDESYESLGLTEPSFDAVLQRAVGNVLAVEIPEGPVEVVEDVLAYDFAEEDFEALSPAEKHVLRLGPDNGRRVQAKLRELAVALGLSVPPGER